MTRPFLLRLLLALLLQCSSIIVGVSARSDNSIVGTTAVDIITVSIPIVRIDLTFLSSGGNNRNLLRGGGGRNNQELELSQTTIATSQQLSQRALQSTSTNNNNNNDNNGSSMIDSSIQSVAETHLTKIYTQQFLIEPSQVLLTVATTNDNDSSSSSSTGGLTTNGIYIRSSFLGGVVSFPTIDNKGKDFTTNIPTRAELEKVTINAFRIPGYGELFLNDLKNVGSDELDGLLLIGVSEVKRDDIADNNAADIASSAETMNSDSDGSTSTMNIWAVAAVAALGAMFLVIILCTSILYCDWRKRKLRRERKREERAHAMQMAAINNGAVNGSMSKKSYSAQGSNKGAASNTYANLEIDNMEAMQNGEFNQPALQIVVPHVASGDTQEIEVSPSTQGSGGVNNNNNVDNNFQPNAQNGSGNGGGGGKGFISKLGVGKSRRSLAKSKAASAQLLEANQVMSSPTSSGGVGGAQGQNNQNAAYTDQNGYVVNQQADVSVGDGYSVGEDTTMLYPTINRGRTMSKDGDGMSDFDGYSMDGMSAMDGGYSQFGGSGNGGGSGVHSSSSKKKNDGNRDMYYTGEVPRDFDSVWGDDDQSKITMDGETSVDFTPAKTSSANNVQAYADLTQNLNQLVEQEYEQDNASSSNNGSNPPIEDFISEQSGGLSVNLHDFDSESESGSKNFTLELLGKKSKVKLGKSTSAGSSSVTPSVDDEDSILGDMYKDETSEMSIGVMGDDISAIEGVDEGGLGEDGMDEGEIEGGEGDKEGQASDDVSIESWAAPIQSALRNSMGIFRTLSKEIDSETNADTPAPSKDEDDDSNAVFTPSESQEQRTKDKFMSGLIADDSSVGSNRSRNSNASSGSRGSHKSSSSRKATTAKSSTEKALGLTNSMEEEVDEDPAAMIDNINSMLSECRTILDTEKDTEP